jgi:serine/threonine protein phosphatase PrpC
MLLSFDAKCIGGQHTAKGLPCQDSANAQIVEQRSIGFAAIADGHGGEKYFRSATGSLEAVLIAQRAMLDFMGKTAQASKGFFDKKARIRGDEKPIRESLKTLEANIIYQWRNKVIAHFKANPLTDEENSFCSEKGMDLSDEGNVPILYGTTLLAAFFKEEYWFTLQIGYGCCVIIGQDGTLTRPIPEDDRLAFGRTTSMCDSNAIENFRESFGFGTIQGITVASDGMADSFEPDKYLDFNKTLYEQFINDSETAQKELEAFLPELSKRGSGDDVSIAGIWRKPE